MMKKIMKMKLYIIKQFVYDYKTVLINIVIYNLFFLHADT